MSREKSKTQPTSSSRGFGGFIGTTAVAERALTNKAMDIALKQMGKRDSTTKLKALEQMKALVEEHAEDKQLLIDLLPQWVYRFNRLAMDNDRKVREALYKTFITIVANVKKGLAMHLKSLYSNWFINIHDPFKDVCKAANSAMEAAFTSPEKRKQAGVFCFDEFITHVTNNFKHTPTTLRYIDNESKIIDEKRVVTLTWLFIYYIIKIVSWN